MKFTAAVALAIAPVVLAKAVHNVYPLPRVDRRDNSKGSSDSGSGHNDKGNGNDYEINDGHNSETDITEIIILWLNPGGGADTTTINSAVTVTQTVTADVAGSTDATVTDSTGSTSTVSNTGTTHTVTVGGSAGLVYSPDTVDAVIGDVVLFTFLSENHTATQSAFATPCERLEGGMDSGFQPNPNNTVNPPPQFAMQVMVDTPLCKFRDV